MDSGFFSPALLHTFCFYRIREGSFLLKKRWRGSGKTGGLIGELSGRNENDEKREIFKREKREREKENCYRDSPSQLKSSNNHESLDMHLRVAKPGSYRWTGNAFLAQEGSSKDQFHSPLCVSQSTRGSRQNRMK